MGTWHVRVQLLGELSGDEQLEELAAGVDAAIISGDTGRIELRFAVNAGDFQAATSKALKRINALAGVARLRAEGLISGPHKLTVMDDLARTDDLDLIGRAEAAELLGVSGVRFDQLRRDREDFPEPAIRTSGGGLYERPAIVLFGKNWQRKPGRPRKAAAE